MEDISNLLVSLLKQCDEGMSGLSFILWTMTKRLRESQVFPSHGSSVDPLTFSS